MMYRPAILLAAVACALPLGAQTLTDACYGHLRRAAYAESPAAAMGDFERAKCHVLLEERFASGIVGGDKPSVDGLAFMLYQRLKASAATSQAPSPTIRGGTSDKRLGGGGVIVVPQFNSQ
jgi:hypothetical protein